MAGRRLVALGLVAGLAAVSAGGFWSAASAAPGNLDPSFGGGDGIVTVPLTNPPGMAAQVAVQPDGKVVVLTALAPAAGFDSLLRLNADGTPDSGFGAGGVAQVGRGSGATTDLTILTDGSIVTVGSNQGGAVAAQLAKFTPAGQPDTTFGGTGQVLVQSPMETVEFHSVYEDGSGLVAVGVRSDFDINTFTTTSGLVAMRFLANGDPDLAYGPGGQIWRPDFLSGVFRAFGVVGVAAQPDGSRLVAGVTATSNVTVDLRAYRVGPGPVVSALNGGSPVRAVNMGGFLAAAPLAGGGMMLGGRGVNAAGSSEARLLQALTPDGALGATSEVDGETTYTDLALLPNGTVAAAASNFDSGADGVVEVRTSGATLDPGFSGDGLVDFEFARALASAPEGKLVAAGGPAQTAEVRRYLGDDAPVPPVPPFGPGPIPLVPDRILDTRTGIGHSGPKPGADATIRVVVAGRGGVPATGAAAVVLNVTATEADAPGFVMVWPTGLPRPNASNLNISGAGQTIPNLVTVPLGADGSVSMFNYGGSHLIADMAAWFPSGGGFVPLTPDRILDTRTGIGHTGPKPGAGATVDLRVVGRGGVASDATAVVLNVTATETDGPGFVTVWPAGGPRPNASNVNISREGENIPNQVYVPVGANGSVSLFTYDGSHLLADVAGYFTAAGGFHPLTPDRILDTRPAAGPIGHAGDKPAAGTTVAVRVAGVGGVRATGATAVVMNVTATEAAGPGFVTAWPSGQARPNASNLNLDQGGQTIANLVVVPIGPDGTVNLFTYDGAHLVADVAGWIG